MDDGGDHGEREEGDDRDRGQRQQHAALVRVRVRVRVGVRVRVRVRVGVKIGVGVGVGVRLRIRLRLRVKVKLRNPHLDIPVHDPPRVAVQEPLDHALEVRRHRALGEVARVDQPVEELAARSHLHEDPR